MIPDEHDLTRREQLLDDRERALLEREEELARQSREQVARADLERPPPLVTQSSRRSLLFLVVFLAALVFLGWIVLRGSHDARSDQAVDPMPFESRKGTGINLEVPRPAEPSTAATQPVIREAPDASTNPVQSQQQELLHARQRAPILITQSSTNSPRTDSDPANADLREVLPALAQFPNPDQPFVPQASKMSIARAQAPDVVDPNSQFQNRLNKTTAATSVATRTPDRQFFILQGKFIDAVSETAINSDLPGQVRALVSHDIYAESGRRVLLPKGTRLLGEYNTAITKGQERLFVVWTRAIRPDGIDIALLSGGTDTLGRAGLVGEVDTHFWTIFGTSALLSIIGAGAATSGVNSGQDQLNSAAIYRAEIAESFNRSATRVLDKYLDIKPTIKIAHGERLTVFVARDLDFASAMAAVEARDYAQLLR